MELLGVIWVEQLAVNHNAELNSINFIFQPVDTGLSILITLPMPLFIHALVMFSVFSINKMFGFFLEQQQWMLQLPKLN